MLTDDRKLSPFFEREVDFSYSMPGVARFRVNAFVQRGSISLVCRSIPFQVKTVAELMLPEVISTLADEEARADPRDRHDRVGQVDDPGVHDRPHQHQSHQAHSHDRGSGRVPASRQGSIINQREVGGHGLVRARSSVCSAGTPT